MTDAKPVVDLRRIALKGETYGERLAALNELANRAEAAERERDSYKRIAAERYDDSARLLRERDEALEMARRYGGNDGGHHKAWVIDQMVRALTGDRYAAWVAAAKAGNDGPETYDWEEGIAP